ncbi:Aliphatic amidase expression-regulating protein [Novipirellula galeiformis]|uniref:Aliphatic amidase expression-regulating protein n=1 Tax=Novipirellula galeiformis TaxID=2528004 RepID=A0A5C6CRX9_9BACT|nr:urea ABC transporter substrate-binding protein [Novipirellula galeiformis]TWU26615.1 Aliphatic amidase expression-regulating protein [Novipirellula galeiformis]
MKPPHWRWLFLATIVLSIAAVLLGRSINSQASRRPIRVGILHSQTGTMAISESPVRDATLMAIEEINASGGILGRPIEVVSADGQSKEAIFASQAEWLIVDEQVSVVFGCWTSASRKAVRPIFERHQHLLFYPVQYEGLEQSPNIVYTGTTPNQQILPAVKWCFDNLGARSFFLVGSDYVFPRTVNTILRTQISALQGEVVGEEYMLLDSEQADAIVAKIVATKPDFILNTLNGHSNHAFFSSLRAAGIAASDIPTMSFSIAEVELLNMRYDQTQGDYAAWTYFQSIASERNTAFVKRFQDRFGSDRVTDDPIEAGYFGVYLWKQAVEDAGTDKPSAVRTKVGNQSFPAPQGIVSIDPETHHTWKTLRIGRIRGDGQFDIVWTSDYPVRPVTFPIYQSREQWEQFLEDMYRDWGQSWSKPADSERDKP